MSETQILFVTCLASSQVSLQLLEVELADRKHQRLPRPPGAPSAIQPRYLLGICLPQKRLRLATCPFSEVASGLMEPPQG